MVEGNAQDSHMKIVKDLFSHRTVQKVTFPTDNFCQKLPPHKLKT